jgi:hypothetical protein
VLGRSLRRDHAALDGVFGRLALALGGFIGAASVTPAGSRSGLPLKAVALLFAAVVVSAIVVLLAPFDRIVADVAPFVGLVGFVTQFGYEACGVFRHHLAGE